MAMSFKMGIQLVTLRMFATVSNDLKLGVGREAKRKV